MKAQRGVALLGVLWVVVTLGTLALGGVAAQRLGGATTLNRLTLARGRWAAEACLALALAQQDSSLAAQSALAAGLEETLTLGVGTTCWYHVADPGERMHADSAPAEARDQLDAIAVGMGLRAESLLTRDGDGRVNLNTAHPAVLAALPGFSEAAVRTVLEQRARGGFTSLEQIIGRLFSPARDSLVANLDDLTRIVRFTPAAVVVMASARAAAGPGVSIEVLVAPLGRRAAVLRRRMW